MRTRHTAILALIVALVSVNLAASEMTSEYISVVEIYVDGLTDAAGVRILETTLMQENGVAEVSSDLENGIMAVTPMQDIGWVNLFNFVQRINGTRQYTVREMNVVALGRLAKFPVDYTEEVYDYGGAHYDGSYDYVKDRYMLQLGDNYLLLAGNDVLNEMIDSGHEIVRVMGTVKNFSARVPIMHIREFQIFGDLEEKEPVENHPVISDATQDRISWVGIQVDGMTCDECVRKVEYALAEERGIASVTGDLETGTVVVIPEMDGEQIKLVNLISRINGTREYVANEMTVVAEGRVLRLPVKYHEPDLHIHNHDRYKLQVGNMHFILSENEKLHELLESGYERVRVAGTVSAFNGRAPIMSIQVLEEPGDNYEAFTYAEPLDDDVSPSVIESGLVKERDGQARIELIRVYVDGFICNICGRILYTDLMKEEGIEAIVTNTDLGLVEIVPKTGEMFDLHSVRQRINAMRDYTVSRMEIVASGEVRAVNFVDHARTSHSRPRAHKRYKLTTGEFTGFILFENKKLKEIVEAEDETVTVAGTVAAFRGKTPILHIRDYYSKIEGQPSI